ncbi:MAG TPA: SAM-dependent methyltransferase [Roseiarcus sp.]|jgi:methyltransferase (TIGR00027 family)
MTTGVLMQNGQFSRTALGAAGHRAAHQVLEGGGVFADPLALRILGEDAEAAIAEAKEEPRRRGVRLFVAMRSRFAEDETRRALARGVRQIVVLGAGLDTFAYRVECAEGLRVYEVDHPSTQAEKRRRLAAASIAPGPHVVFAACDFERQGFVEALAAAGFDAKAPAFFLWLGVMPYLSEPAIISTFAAIASLPGGAEVAFDYANPSETIDDPTTRATHEELARRVAEAGEPLRTFFDTPALHARLSELGLTIVEDLGPAEITERFFPGAPARSGAGAHVALAATRGFPR